MVTEYLLLLVLSAFILGASFGLSTGPIEMFKRKTPVLACKIESNLRIGENFRDNVWEDPSGSTASPSQCP